MRLYSRSNIGKVTNIAELNEYASTKKKEVKPILKDYSSTFAGTDKIPTTYLKKIKLIHAKYYFFFTIVAATSRINPTENEIQFVKFLTV